MILVTVGSMFPFDRLVRAVDDLVASGEIVDEVVAQIGSGRYEPCAMRFERYMEKQPFDELLARADVIVSHAGIGSIATALRFGKPMLVLPRLRRHAEHVNDHQLATAQRYEALGHVLAARDESELAAKLALARSFRPLPRHVDAAGLAGRVGRYLEDRLAAHRGAVPDIPNPGKEGTNR